MFGNLKKTEMMTFTPKELDYIQVQLSTPNSILIQAFSKCSEIDINDFFSKEAYSLLAIGKLHTTQFRLATEDAKNAAQIASGVYTLRTHRMVVTYKPSGYIASNVDHLEDDEFDYVVGNIPTHLRVPRKHA
jgi:hypothetical protein